MTEPRHHAGVTDPEDTTRIRGDALGDLRDDATERGGTDGGGRLPPADGRADARPDPRGDRVNERAGERSPARPADRPAERRETDRAGRRPDPEAAVAPRYLDPSYGSRPDDAGRAGASNGRNGYPPRGYAGSVSSADARATAQGGTPRHSSPGHPGGAPSGRRGGPPESPPPTAATGAYGSSEASRPAASAYAGYPGDAGYGQYGGPARARDDSTTATAYTGLGAGYPPGVGAGVGTAPYVGGSTLGTSPTGRSAARPGRGAVGARPARRARLLVRHIDPWSTFKFSLVLSVALFFVWLVAVGLLYGVLDGIGVFDKINGLYDELSGNTGDRIVTPGMVLGMATLIGAVNIVLMTALATIGAFIYNVCSDLVGGIEVTLAERE
jgi:Transmembrane domain of unknown function (DUF3566)